MPWLEALLKLFRTPAAPKPMRQRSAPRFETQGFNCSLGEIVDLSQSGMRVFSAKRPAFEPGHTMSLAVQSPFQRIVLRGTVAWVKQTGLGVWQMGVRFIDLQPGMGQVLEAMARFGVAELPQNTSAPVKGAAKAPVTPSFNPVHPAEQVRGQQTAQRASDVPLQASAYFEDYYGIFGLKPGATAEEIHAAYRVLARRYHPDTAENKDYIELFTIVHKAYEVLSDPEKRAAYDAERGFKSAA